MGSKETAAHSSDVRERILDAAATVFAERGFGGAGVDEIARRAGVNKAMLYYHVGDKAALFAQVVEFNVEMVRRAVSAALTGLTDPCERLRAIPRAIASVVAGHRCLPQLMLREIAAGGPNLPQEAVTKIAEIAGLTRGVIEDGLAEGRFRRVDPLVVHLVLVGSLMFMANALAMQQRLAGALPLPPDTPASLETVAGQLFDITLNGIATHETPGGR